jgi:hypothetical protein
MGCASSVDAGRADQKYRNGASPTGEQSSLRTSGSKRANSGKLNDGSGAGSQSPAGRTLQEELESRKKEASGKDFDSDDEDCPTPNSKGKAANQGGEDPENAVADSSPRRSKGKSKPPPPSSSWARYVIAPQDSASVQLMSTGSKARLTSSQLSQYDAFGSPKNDTSSMFSGRAEQELGASFSQADPPGLVDTATINSQSVASATGSVNSETLMRRAQRLEQSLERRLSEGNLADEPSRIGEQFKLKALVAKARLLNGITSDVDQFKENIEKENLKYLQIQPEKLLRICEYVDLLIEAMLDFPMQQQQHSLGNPTNEPSDSLSQSGYSVMSDDCLVPLQIPGNDSVQAGPLSPPMSRRASVTSTADLPGTVPAPEEPSSSSQSFQGNSHSQKLMKPPLQGAAVTTSIKVLEYEVFLTTANLVSQEYVAPSSPIQSQPPASPRSATRSPQPMRLQSDTNSTSRSGRGRQEKVSSSRRRDQVDEVDQLIFGT